MKNILLITLLALATSGCGFAYDLGDGCNKSGFDLLCGDQGLKEIDRTNTEVSELRAELAELQRRLDLLETQVTDMLGITDALAAELDTQADENEQTQAIANTALINAANASLAAQAVGNQLANLESELNSESRVIASIDPCGNGPGYDEVLLVTNDNKLIAYFEQSGKRFLTILEPGNYRTTDNQGCNFSVSSNGTVSF